MADVKLKACPFCHVELESIIGDLLHIKHPHTDPPCVLHDFELLANEQDIEDWNTRPIEDTNAALLREAATFLRRIEKHLHDDIDFGGSRALIQRLEEAGKE